MEDLADNATLKTEQQKELYVATIVHDLKNPLNAQIAALEQLYKEKLGTLNALQKEFLKDIISSAKFMNEMISSLLSIYKFENGAAKLNKTNVNIETLIKHCIKDFTPLADEHLISIEFFRLSKTTILMCDENYLRRVVLNLLNNIIIYSYKNTKALISLDENNFYILISFKSKGQPIDDELKSHIFDKYVSSTAQRTGTGLGLYFCKKVIDAHGGFISLNTKNSDIEFCIKLPKTHSGKDIIKFK